MRRRRSGWWLIMLGAWTAGALAQGIDARALLNRVQERFDAINDYQVKVHLAVAIPNFRMPNKDIEVFFKKPDKLKVKASGFAPIPKYGFVPAPAAFLNDSINVEYVRAFRQGTTNYHVVKLTPKVSNKVNAAVLLRINAERWTIDRVVLDFGKIGQTSADISYRLTDGFWMPETTLLIFDLARNVPPVERPNINRPFGGMERFGNDDEQPMQGRITITFSDFAVNRGIDDRLFDQKRK